ncbi:MAG: flap endonuclease-1 [Candidatus Pacearchaeota archaeon]
MGVQIADIIPRKEIDISLLKGKTIAVDAMNTLYQFLTTIRQQDGTPLMDSKGKITSHLSGLFYRNISLLSEGIELVYVFDGKPSELKRKELEERAERKKEALEKYEEAKEKGEIEEMAKYSRQFVRINEEIIKESKELLSALGISFVESINEGEAEASFLAKSNVVWACASQDYDSLLYGTPRLIRNLTLARKRRTSSGVLVDVNLELIELQHVLETLQIDRDGLICLGIIVGTDFNPGGIKGLGQKKALEIVRKYKYPALIFDYLQKSGKYVIDFIWTDIFKEFKEYKGNNISRVEKKKIDFDKVKKILLERDFSEERIDNALEKLKEIQEQKKQVSLKDFF